MQHREGRFTAISGQSIYTQVWRPDGPEANAKTLMLLVHGAGEHSGRYVQVAQYFCDRGYVVAGLDHIGHGKSDGKYGFINQFSDYVDTVETYRKKLSQEFPGLPMILLGHSMGGTISAQLLLQQQSSFIGCVLSGAAIKSELEISRLQTWLINFLSRALPNFGMLQLDASGVSRDLAVVEAYRKDPLVYRGKMSARLLAELLYAMSNIQEKAAEIVLPLLTLHGGADVMTAPAGSEFVHAKASSKDRTLKIYPELFHEILNEPERLQVLSEIHSWCEQRLPSQ